MGLRPGRCYRRLERPYTRVAVRVPEKNYIGGVPPVRIRKFVTGNPHVDADAVFYLVAKDALQIRDNALEAARMMANRYLEKKLTDKGYFLRLRVFPHHI
ncbi:TPA: 50S ribosomal protein L16, partial [Candidatus Micrarchaeota archaeon]|nr:50S ribosomal protein L16 [Candidatus Micrarchaeota archaeon]